MKQWTIGKKLRLGFGIISLFLLLLAGIAWRELGETKKRMDTIAAQAGKVAKLAEVNDSLDEIQLKMWGLVTSANAAEANEDKASIAKLEEGVKTGIAYLKGAASHQADKDLLAKLEEVSVESNTFNHRVIDMALKGDVKAQDLFETEGEKLANEKLGPAVVALLAYRAKRIQEEKLAGEAAYVQVRWTLACGVLFSLGMAGLFSITISGSIVKVLSRTAHDLAQGSEQVASASSQIASASQGLADGSNQQAASLEESGASLEEISCMTKSNVSNAVSAAALSSETRQAAEAGSLNMQEMSKAMSDIQASSNNISDIIKTIDEIAFQTNILALNAAVEAARAGQAGAGFAVVADEVRNLAQRSAQAAKETAEKIEDSIAKSSNGVAISEKVTESLDQIVAKACKVDDLVANIATASQEQSHGIDQLNVTVFQMDKVTQSTASTAEETASASEELSGQASALRELVGGLEKLVGVAYQSSRPSSNGSRREILKTRLVPTPASAISPTQPALTSSKMNSDGEA